MTALTVGVTTARDPECKRGVAVNLAASLARGPFARRPVCVVDGDPLTRDVTTRLPVRGPALEDFAGREVPDPARLGRVFAPPLSVLPTLGVGLGRVRLAAERALPRLTDAYEVVVCDLLGGPSGAGRIVGARLDALDWLLLAVTPSPAALRPAVHFLEMFETARTRGAVGMSVRLAVVCTGDERSAILGCDEVEARLDAPVLGRVPQLWGRAAPNLGFGAALAIPAFDDAVDDLFGVLSGAPRVS